MKKFFLLLSGVMLVASCSKNAEQVDAAKAKLAELGDKNVEQLDFTVTEVKSLDVYKKISTSYQRSYRNLSELGELDAAGKQLETSSKYLTLAENNPDKTFYIVTGLQVAAGDTIHKKIFYIDDKNQVIDFENLK